MSAIGIITINDKYNIGNRLQNYALQETLRDLGHDPHTIRNTPILGDGGGPLKRRVALVRSEGLRPYADKLRKRGRASAEQPVSRWKVPERAEGISDFNRKHIAEWPQAYSDFLDRRELAPLFDKFVVGSDQVWNPRYRLLNGVDFLTFARTEQRIAYAASIGIEKLSRHEKSLYRAWLHEIPYISVREDRAAELVHGLIGRRVPVVLDPTLLPTGTQWRELGTVPASLDPQTYVLQFFLGDDDHELRRYAAQYAGKNSLRVVDGNSLVERGGTFLASPEDFLGAIGNARLVVTDSYHAAVFSIIFQIPFVAVPRGGMNSRLETLSAKTGIAMRIPDSLSRFEAATDVDWQSVGERVEKERRLSLAFLNTAFES